MGNSACFSGLTSGAATTYEDKKQPLSVRQVTLSEMLDEQDKPVRGDSRSTIAPSEAAWSESAWSLGTWSPVGDVDIEGADDLTTELLTDAKPVAPQTSKRFAADSQDPKRKSSVLDIVNRFRFASAPAAVEITSNGNDLYDSMFDSKPTATSVSKQLSTRCTNVVLRESSVMSKISTRRSSNVLKEAPARRWSIGGDMFATTVGMDSAASHSPDDDDLLLDVVRPRNSHYA